MKKIIKLVLGNKLYNFIVRIKGTLLQKLTSRYSKAGIDKKLESLMPHKNGYYVELGANNGMLASNSYYFEIKKQWKGVLIEPVPSIFLECLGNRGEHNKFFCNACVSFDYTDDVVLMKYADDMSISESLDLDIGNHDKFINNSYVFNQDPRAVVQFGAMAKTLSSILEESKAPSMIDFLSLDVEGAELDVLKGINFDQFNFKYIVIECRNVDRICSFLLEKNYEIMSKLTHHDYLFKYR